MKKHTAPMKTKFRSISVAHLHCLLVLVYQHFKDLTNQNYSDPLQNKITNRNVLCGLIIPPLLIEELGNGIFFHLQFNAVTWGLISVNQVL